MAIRVAFVLAALLALIFLVQICFLFEWYPGHMETSGLSSNQRTSSNRVDRTPKEALSELKNTTARAIKIIELQSNDQSTTTDYSKNRHYGKNKFQTQGKPDTYFDVDKAKEVLARDRVKPKRVIAMALFGDKGEYMTGAVENAIIVLREWDDTWRLRVYFDQTVPAKWIELLHSLHVELYFVNRDGPRDHSYLFWRFFILEDPDVTRFIVRDSDSRVSLRDRSCVDDWIQSEYLFHTLHDHKYHTIAILGGMWGSVGGLIRPKIMKEWRASYGHEDFNSDQLFLKGLVWPHVRPHTLGHASFHCDEYQGAETRAFPVKRDGIYDFVGNAFRAFSSKDGTYGPIFEIDIDCPVSCRPKAHQDWKKC